MWIPVFLQIFNESHMTPSDNTGRMMTKRIRARDGTTLVLNYPKFEAAAMRALVQSIRIKGDKSPSLSLIARRSMRFYLARLESAKANHPDAYAAELFELESMVTPVPQPAQHSKKQST
jgi:hypothetical protein